MLHATLAAQRSLWIQLLHHSTPLELPKEQKYSEVTSYSERTSRGLPHTCFFLLSRSNRGRSNRIRKHTGAPNTMARKKASLSLEIQVGKVLVAFFTSSVLPLPFLSTQTANSVVSRGLTKCTVFTIGNEKKKKKKRVTEIYQRMQEVPRPLLSHSHALKHSPIFAQRYIQSDK